MKISINTYIVAHDRVYWSAELLPGVTYNQLVLSPMLRKNEYVIRIR
jgi:hypothetical protein